MIEVEQNKLHRELAGHISARIAQGVTKDWRNAIGEAQTSWGRSLHLSTRDGQVSLIGDTWSVTGEDKIREAIEKGGAWLSCSLWHPDRETPPGALPREISSTETTHCMGLVDAANEKIHKNRHPVTGGCLDCGATPEAISDGIANTCYDIRGPYTLALQALAKTIWDRACRIEDARSELARVEEDIVTRSRHLRTAEAALRDLRTTFEKFRLESIAALGSAGA